MFHELDEVQFEYDIINLLKSKVHKNVVGSYPEDKTTFPLIVTSMTIRPTQYDISKNIIRERINFTIRTWANSKTELVKTKQKFEKAMIGFGFTKNNPTEIIVDNTNGKFFMSEQFNISFDNIANRFERSI